jgi:iron complex outermembrane recepter protein
MVLLAGSAFAQSPAKPAGQASPALAAAAQAQASPAPAATPQAEASPVGVEEIVVTAQKRAQFSQQVPIALTAFTSSTLRFRAIDDLSDLQMQVPGMAFSSDESGGQQIFIRGIGIDDTSGTIESPIATYVDGVYQTRTFRAPTLGIDVDRVEVLKGPQGTLFGRNATGGAVNIILKPPEDEYAGEIRGGTGSYGQWLTQGAFTGPLIKNILDFRISGAVARDGGWIENLNSGRDVNDHLEGDGRVALAFHPTDNFSADYELLLSKIVGGGVAPQTTNIEMGTPAIQKEAGLPITIPPSDYVNGNNPWKGKFTAFPFSGDMENTQNSLTLNWDYAPWAQIKSISAFQEHSLTQSFPIDAASYPIVNFSDRNLDDKFFSQEFDLNGNHNFSLWREEDPITWIFGAYYGHETYVNNLPNIAIFDSEETEIEHAGETLNDVSVFGDTTIPLPFHLSLFGGVRYTYDRKSTRQTIALRAGSDGPYFPYEPAYGTCLDSKFIDNFHNISPRVGMGWAPTETLNFYVKYSEGYNAGGHYYEKCDNGYKAETLDTIEGGVKARWFDGRLVVDAAGYYNKFKNFQIDQQVGIVEEVVNAPEAENWGGEFEVTAIPFENFTANAGVSVMHSQYDNFFDTNTMNPKAGPQDLSGNQMERAPNSTELIGLQYDWQVPWNRILPESTRSFLDPGPLKVRGEWFHTDYIVFYPFGKTGFAGANDVQNPYSIFNFYASLPTEDDKWSISFFAKNLTATKYFSYKIPFTWGWAGVGGQPQWFGGEIAYKF